MLPPDASGWPEDRRRTFLLHELAHVRRHDCLIQTLGHLARLLYWPNPLTWWLVGRLRAEAERACDDHVLSAGASASDYAAHLLDAARELKQAQRALAVLAVVERSRLEDRLLALLDPGVRRGVLTGRSLVFGSVLSLTLVCSVAVLQPVARAVATSVAGLSPHPSEEEPPVDTPGVAPQDQKDQPRETRLLRDPPPSPPETVGLEHARREDDGLLTAEGPEPEASPSVVAVDAAQIPVTAEPVVVAKGSPPSAQTPTTTPPMPNVPVIRISTELVQIDAVVTDKAGRHVVDLQPGDFTVFESGRRQKISHLVFVKTGQGPTTGGAAALAAVPQTAAPRTLLLVVDDLSLSLHSMVRTRRFLTAFADTGLGPADRAAIVKTSAVENHVLLTSDTSAFRAAAAGLRYNVWSRSASSVDEAVGASGLAIDSLGALKRTIDALRAVPGRKAVILVSEGFQTLASHDRDRLLGTYTHRPVDGLYEDTGVRAALRSLTDLANRASVVIYTIDPTGLTTDAVGADSRDSGFTASPRIWFNRQGRQASLIELAEQTGGLAVRNQNDLTGGFERILADHAGYYLIGYEPDSATFSTLPGRVRFHEVKVEVKRRGLTVRSRKGFYGVPDEVVAKAAPPLTN